LRNNACCKPKEQERPQTQRTTSRNNRNGPKTTSTNPETNKLNNVPIHLHRTKTTSTNPNDNRLTTFIDTKTDSKLHRRTPTQPKLELVASEEHSHKKKQKNTHTTSLHTKTKIKGKHPRPVSNGQRVNSVDQAIKVSISISILFLAVIIHLCQIMF
jgi:hypothetical protein